MSGVGGVTVVGQPDGDRERVAAWAGPAGAAGSAGAAGGGDLRHSRGPWLRAAGGADQLVTLLGPVKGELDVAHQGVTAGAGALSALAELGAVRASWERRFEDARKECGSLGGKMRAVVRGQTQANEAVKSGFDGVRTPSVGGAR
ncbi:hypothetical protein ACH43Y_32710 [Streptomyces rubiginosohelvolus]|uniref:hypothetical protein n=1 Tax=Streptomyces rubiginosohelvolus TaxID=67362 RepID=UPI003796D53F